MVAQPDLEVLSALKAVYHGAHASYQYEQLEKICQILYFSQKVMFPEGCVKSQKDKGR